MSRYPKWQYDEMKHCGVDYSNQAQIEVYDKRHQRFRDYEKESLAIIDRLELGADDTVIDIGCGTGAFTLCAAKSCKKMYAVDVSKAMLGYCKQKAQKTGLNNIEFCHGGFLTYEHCSEPVDSIVSIGVLHHIPDFWKLIGLRRIAAMLKNQGKFFLGDVVFSFDVTDYELVMNEWVKSVAQNVGPEFGAEVETHACDEYSTFDWIMEGMLEKAGFEIEHRDYRDGFFASYLCIKASEVKR